MTLIGLIHDAVHGDDRIQGVRKNSIFGSHLLRLIAVFGLRQNEALEIWPKR